MNSKIFWTVLIFLLLPFLGSTLVVAETNDEPAPPPGKIYKRPTAKSVDKHHWFKFGGHYWRLWGGAKTGSLPKGVSVTPDGKHVFVTNFGQKDTKNVFRYDATTLEKNGSGDHKGNGIESMVSKDSSTLYITSFFDNEVVAMDTDTLEVKGAYAVGRVPKHFALTPDESQLYVANWLGSDASVVDMSTGQEIKRIKKMGKWPRGTIVTNDGKKAYITSFGDHLINVIDTETMKIIKRIKRCPKARHGDITKDDKWLLVGCYGSWTVAVIDTEIDKIVRYVKVGNGPKTLEISADERFAYTADYRGSTMSIIDMQTWKAMVVPVPTVKTSGLAVSHDDRKVYITGFDSLNLLAFERLAPGQEPLELGPEHPPKKCYRKDPALCKKFP